MLLFLGAVIGLSFLVLTIVFRSVLVPLKAALLNLISIGRRTASSWPSSSGAGAPA